MAKDKYLANFIEKDVINMMDEQKSPKKPLIFYYLIVMVILMLLNVSVFPMLFSSRVPEVDYGTFLKAIDNGEVTRVQVQEDEKQIVFSKLDEDGEEVIYVTKVMNDPELVNRLYNSENEIVFSQLVPKENSPLLSFILSWILPIAVFIGLGQLFSRQMQKSLGGKNALSFGKSNAKIYVKAQTGTTFADVAGQDEAKEALNEIVDFLHHPDKYTQIGATLPKGVLLVGPPGTGKNLDAPEPLQVRQMFPSFLSQALNS